MTSPQSPAAPAASAVHGAARADKPIIVIGAGIIGAVTALRLATAGQSVVLLDAGEPGMGCSYGNGGAISPDFCVPIALPGMIKRVPRWFADPLGPLVVRWSDLPAATPWLVRWLWASRMAQVEPAAVALRALHASSLDDYARLLGPEAHGLIEKTGQLYVWRGTAPGPTEELARQLRERHGVETRALDSAAIKAIDPELAPGFVRGLFFPDNGHTVNPLRLVQTLVRLFVAAGGSVVRDRFEGFVHQDGQVAAIRCASGQQRPASAVVVATGMDGVTTARELGDRIPLQAERGYHVMLPDPVVRPVIKISNRDHMFGLTPMEHGVRIAGTVEIARPDAPRNDQRAWALLTQAKRMYPRLNGEGAQIWMGCRPSTPDSLPVIDRARRARNVIYAFGHGHTGLTGAPMTAALVAEALGLGPAGIAAQPYRVDRFRAGAPAAARSGAPAMGDRT